MDERQEVLRKQVDEWVASGGGALLDIALKRGNEEAEAVANESRPDPETLLPPTTIWRYLQRTLRRDLRSRRLPTY